VRVAATAAGALASIVLTQFLVADPARVDELTVRNPTEYPMYLSLAGAEGSSPSPLMVVGAGGTVVMTDVLDPGPTWRLSMTAQGRDAGVMKLERAQVLAAGGLIVVPDSAAQRLRADGVAPPPSRG
jgi:hypothetical protein